MTPEQVKVLVDGVLANVDRRNTAFNDALFARLDTLRSAIDATALGIQSGLADNRVSLAADLASALAPYLDVPAPAPSSTSPVPLSYQARTDRVTLVKPPLPPIGLAGSSILDPSFGTRIRRITDASTALDVAPNRSFRTPSSVHARAWSADSKAFYVTSSYGNILPFSFDPATGKAARIGSQAPFFGEPNFHPTKPGVLVGAPNGTNPYRIASYDVLAAAFTNGLNLPAPSGIDLSNPRTYVGDTGISGDSNRVFAFYGGTGQDKHYLVFISDIRGATWLLDTLSGTLNGKPVTAPLGAHLHSVGMDRSGRFLKLTWAAADNKGAGPYWDLETNTFTIDTTASGGHDAFGYGWRINQACVGSPYDAAQWQLRKLDALSNPKPLINPVMTPKLVSMADHPSWHNAQPDRLVPFISALYRYGKDGFNLSTYPWRAWDDEIVAVQTDVPVGQGATVWRFAHHRSDVAWWDTIGRDTSRYTFWAMPRPQVSPDGRYVLFTSNWEGTLGDDPKGSVEGGLKRQDVFLAELEA